MSRQAKLILSKLQDADIKMIDTAVCYGDSERVLANIQKKK